MHFHLALTYTSADILLPPSPCRSTSSYTRDAVSSWAIASARSRGPSAQPVMPRSPKSLCPGASTTSPCSAATLTPCLGSRLRTSRCDLWMYITYKYKIYMMYMFMHMHMYMCIYAYMHTCMYIFTERERERTDRGPQCTTFHAVRGGAWEVVVH